MGEFFGRSLEQGAGEFKSGRGSGRTPGLRRILHELGPLPQEALFMGIAPDGLPVLLNLHDPVPGPILIVGEEQSGKTAFLKNIAAAAEATHGSENLQYAVLTTTPEEWKNLGSENMVAVFDIQSQEAEDLVLSMASWAHGNKNSMQSVILMIDGLDKAGKISFDMLQNLRWLLLRGPSRKVWTIATYGADNKSDESLLGAFHTRIYGNISASENIRRWNLNEAQTDSLQEGVQFQLREGKNWLRFWIPK